MRFKVLAIILLGTSSLAFYNLGSIELEFPNYFPTPKYNLAENPLTQEKINLGRALFYDPILSSDNSISCASCHSPYNAFAHSDHNLSHGINDEIGTRNAPALFNLAWQQEFMWDGAINHLDVQALAPLSHPKEMNEDLKHVVEKLQNSSIYPRLFYEAFKDSTITGQHFLKALVQFQLTLVSATSKYDKVKSNIESFTDQEERGYTIFLKHCNSCHTEPLFSNYEFSNNGLFVDSTLNDFGKWKVTKQAEDSLTFKVPSLRNLSYSYPYMHDGRFKKLNQVLNHYRSKKLNTKTLAQQLKSPLDISSNEQADLIAFLLCLDDQEFVFDPKNKFPRKILLQNEGINK